MRTVKVCVSQCGICQLPVFTATNFTVSLFEINLFVIKKYHNNITWLFRNMSRSNINLTLLCVLYWLEQHLLPVTQF